MMPFIISSKKTCIKAAARASALSKAQLREVESLIKPFYPSLRFEPIFLHTQGDVDKITSLRSLEKTDFFTKELDGCLLQGKCDVAIHSAKDLPDPLPQGIVCVALTKGIDPRDSLVMARPGTIHTLPYNAKIGTSSLRREENLKRLRSDLITIDIRGTIEERLSKLKNELDGVVVAQAALIRLNLAHLPSVFIPGEVSPLQGRLAVLARREDIYMKQLFSVIDYTVL